MADIDFQTKKRTNNAVTVNCGKPQQDLDYARPMEVAASVPCDVSSISITSTRLLRLPELLARLHVCRATIYLYISKGTFPKPIAISPRAVGWLEHEIDAWLAAKIQARQVTKL